MKRLTHIVFLLALLATGCEPLSGPFPQITNPPPSQYPADISATVLVTNNITGVFPNSTNKFNIAASTNRVFWVVDIVVKNKSYPLPIISNYDRRNLPKGVGQNIIWSTIIDGKVWSDPVYTDRLSSPALNVSQNQVGTTRLCFEAPRNINPKDAQIRYAGEAVFSFGNLTEIRRVATYDWNSNRVVSTQVAFTTPANVQVREPYLLLTMASSRVANLKTVQSWNGSSTKEISFRATTTPWVINAGFTPTSSISTKFNVTVWKGDLGTFTFTQNYGQFTGVRSAIIEETGNYVIKVEASGCNWWVKVGVE